MPSRRRYASLYLRSGYQFSDSDSTARISAVPPTRSFMSLPFKRPRACNGQAGPAFRSLDAAGRADSGKRSMELPQNADATETSRITVSGHQVDVGDGLRDHATTQLAGVASKYFGGAEDI